MNTPTPGPWHVEKPFQEPGTYISSPHTALVAKVWDNDETAANARLLAAAPELLSSLQEISAWMEATFSSAEKADWLMFDRAKAAILKATTP